jgi:putative restriction endonuclease
MITEFDTQLRREAVQWLTVRTHDGAASISSADLLDFEIGGRQFRLMDQRGIRKPRELSAALSIRTVYTPNGQTRPYDDSVGSDGLLRYKWRGDNPGQAENRALRAAMENRLPLIWFFWRGARFVRAGYPVYLLWEEPDHHQFVIDPDVARGLVSAGRRCSTLSSG